MADKPRDPSTGQFVSPAPVAETPVTPPPAPTPEPAPVAAKSPYDLGDTKLDGLDFLEIPSAAKQPDSASLPAATPPTSTPPVPTDKRRLRLAQDLGLTEAQASALSPQELDDEIYVRTRTLAASRTPSPPEAPRPAPAPAAPPEEPPALDFGDFEKELNPAFSKGLKDSLGKVIAAEVGKAIKPYQQKLAERDQRDAEAKKQHWYQKFDAHFAKHPAVFGATRAAAHADPALMEARNFVLDSLAGHPEAAWDEKIARAVALLARAQPAAPAAAPPAVTPEGYARPTAADYDQGGLSRPTDRSRQEPKGRIRAEKVAAEWMKQNGFMDDDEADLSGFLPARAS